MRKQADGCTTVDQVANLRNGIGEMEKRGPGEGGREEVNRRGRYAFPCQEQGGWQRRAWRPKL
jgi:hypothetical protein